MNVIQQFLMINFQFSTIYYPDEALTHGYSVQFTWLQTTSNPILDLITIYDSSNLN